MTWVTLRGSDPCPLCGHRRPALRLAKITVLAHTLRQEWAIVVNPGRCRECGWHGQETARELRFRLDAKDQATVERVRARRRRKTAA